jgi:hypothetical protein
VRLPPIFGPTKPLGPPARIGPYAFVPPASQDLAPPFPLTGQLQDNWCWAAVSQGVADHFGGAGVTQCDVATGTLPDAERNSAQCCATARGGDCDKPYYLEQGLGFVGHFDRMSVGSAGFTAIRAEIGGGRPLCVRTQWPDRSGHFVVVTGWEQPDNGQDYVHVHDPAGPTYSVMTLRDLQIRYTAARGRWTHCYFTAAAPAGGAAYLAGAPDPSTLGG